MTLITSLQNDLQKVTNSSATVANVVNEFVDPTLSTSDGNTLPSSKVPNNLIGAQVRNIIHWLVPEVGIVKMYINPQSINYSFSKLIVPSRTKGGYLLQYWGEELPTLRIQGHTGTSGVEGLNVLYEIYRSEQLTFDAAGQTLAANNSSTGLTDLINSTLSNIGGIGTSVAATSLGTLGLNPQNQTIEPNNIPTLASLAFGIEMYYTGWVFRGYFKDFSFDENVNSLGLFNYNIDFVVTQRRGYRTNSLAWQKSANSGQSGNSIPYTFSSLTSPL